MEMWMQKFKGYQRIPFECVYSKPKRKERLKIRVQESNYLNSRSPSQTRYSHFHFPPNVSSHVLFSFVSGCRTKESEWERLIKYSYINIGIWEEIFSGNGHAIEFKVRNESWSGIRERERDVRKDWVWEFEGREME